jgi:hypothetical protein
MISNQVLYLTFHGASLPVMLYDDMYDLRDGFLLTVDCQH